MRSLEEVNGNLEYFLNQLEIYSKEYLRSKNILKDENRANELEKVLRRYEGIIETLKWVKCEIDF